MSTLIRKETGLTASVSDGTIFEVRSVRLSDVIKAEGSVDLLKLDCEGSEFAMLEEAGKTGCLRHVKSVVAEVHRRLLDILTFMAGQGYRVSRLKRILPSCYIVEWER